MNDWWKDYPWRLIQTNLREIDMGDIHAAQVVSDLQAFKATILMINAAGIIASYPTALPYQFQSPYLTGDSLLQIIEACHAEGIRVFARTDFSKIRRPIYELHPEWAYRSAHGQIVDYNGDVHVCVNSWYQQQGILNILGELFDSHPFDGVFFNMGGYVSRDYSGNDHGPCCCQNCQRRYLEMFSEPFPLPGPDLEMGSRYPEFKRLTLRDQEEKVYRFLADRYPHLCIANHLRYQRGFIRQEANTAVDRPLPLWQYSASENTRWAVGSYPSMVSSSTTVDFIDFPYRHAAVSPHEQSLRLAQNLANGGALDYYLIGRLDNHADRSGYKVIQDLFHYHASHEGDYQRLRSRAEILLIKPASESLLEYRGWFRVLVENHFIFDVITLESALQQPWSRYRLIILPQVTFLPRELSQELDDFVASGGTLIASGQTAFRDEAGSPQVVPSLKCLGISQVQAIRGEMRAAYFQVLDKTFFPHLQETDLVYLDGSYIYAEYSVEASPFLDLVPPHNYGPPERCYFEQVTTHPALIRHPYGRGRALYLPWLPGTQFYQHGHLNTLWFMTDLLQQVAGAQPVQGNLPAQVEVTLMDNAAGALLLHLVNTSGHFGNTYHAPLPIHDLEISLPWQAAAPASIRLLRLGLPLEFEISDGSLYLRLPVLDLFEAIEIL